MIVNIQLFYSTGLENGCLYSQNFPVVILQKLFCFSHPFLASSLFACFSSTSLKKYDAKEWDDKFIFRAFVFLEKCYMKNKGFFKPFKLMFIGKSSTTFRKSKELASKNRMLVCTDFPLHAIAWNYSFEWVVRNKTWISLFLLDCCAREDHEYDFVLKWDMRYCEI